MSKSTPIPVFTLQIKGFPVELTEKLERIAASQHPRTTRNSLIEFVLGEYADGRLVPAPQANGKEAA